MRHGSLFSGIGGFDLSAEWMGWENVFHCEIKEFNQRILKYYWPQAISYHDIKTTDFTIHRGKIDLLSGGFPCQPYSTAGKRKGKDDERHLWPEMLRAIREIKPTWVVGENVRGLINWNGGLVFEEVQADLEAEGYEVQPVLLPAAGVNAPHERYRIWFVAYRNSIHASRHGHGETGPEKKKGKAERKERERLRTFSERIGEERLTANHPQRINRKHNAESEKRQESEPRESFGAAALSNTDQFNGELSGFYSGEISQQQKAGVQQNITHTNGIGRSRSKNETKGQFTTNRDAWDQFPTQSPICSGNDGFPLQLDGITFSSWRGKSIEGYGNAIVPQEVYMIYQAIENYINLALSPIWR